MKLLISYKNDRYASPKAVNVYDKMYYILPFLEIHDKWLPTIWHI
jgi:hypothetical protein